MKIALHARDDHARRCRARSTRSATSGIRSSTSTCRRAVPACPSGARSARHVGRQGGLRPAGARSWRGCSSRTSRQLRAPTRSPNVEAPPVRGVGPKAWPCLIAITMSLRSRHRPGDPRPAPDGDQDLLRLSDRVRRAAEHARLPGVPRAARRAAGAQSPAVDLAVTAALALGCEVTSVGLRAQELLLSRSAEGLSDLAVRAAAGTRRRARDRRPADVRVRAAHAHPHGRGRGQVAARRLRRFRSQDLPRLQPQRRAADRDRHRAGHALGGEAAAFFETLRQILVWLGVNDGNMEEGSLRCDANVSVRPAGRHDARHQGRGQERQLVPLPAEGDRVRDRTADRRARARRRVVQETRLFDAAQGKTYSMRSKEEAHDYRYFPEPDLPPLVVAATPRAIARRCRSCPRRAGRASSRSTGCRPTTRRC